MTSAATGVMTSVIGKLTTLLGNEYKLVKGVKPGIRFLRDELSSMNAVLQRLADMDEDQIDVQTKEWRNKVRELSYDIEDCIDRFMLRHSQGHAKANFVLKAVRKMKMPWEDRQIAKDIQELKGLVEEEKKRHDRYKIGECIALSQPVVRLDPRANIMFEEARDLVGIDGPREKIIGWLKGEETQLKVVSIFGIGGQGKTTLAMEVYRKIDETFDRRASVSVSRTPDIKKVLRDILFQINKREYEKSVGWDVEQLKLSMRKYLTDKRYIIVIDDIWSVLAWDHVKSALPANNNRSRIITTTRIKSVAESCCTGSDGHMYEAEPLSEVDSRRLFFKRTFCSEEECPQELREVANGILRKCGGLPLAIITIAGLAYKSTTVEVWAKILNSISFAVEKGSQMEKIRQILLLSYFDLPHYLKSCLLYLSVFPENYLINTRHLIWRWVAEGLIPGHNRESMEQLGESYLNELINRSMIQPTKIGVDGTKVKACRVHDVVLEFIISQAVDENFVTISNTSGVSGNPLNRIRRLSFQSEMATTVVDVSHLRSLSMYVHSFAEAGKQVPWYFKSQVLRVLNIELTQNSNDEDCYAEYIGNMAQLKYLRISCNNSKLSEQIGNLQQLEILDLGVCPIGKLPSSIVQLRNLVHLFIPRGCPLPDGIGNLQALEELSYICGLDKVRATSIQELGKLIKLRELGIDWQHSGMTCEENYKVLVSSLSKLMACGLRSLKIINYSDKDYDSINQMVSCGSAPALWKLKFSGDATRTIPSGIGSLVNLTVLRISFCHYPVCEVVEKGLKILATLPVLLSLTVGESFSKPAFSRHLIGIDREGFQRLVKFDSRGWLAHGTWKFEPGAMPKLQRLKLELAAQFQFEYAQEGRVIGLQNLASLKHMTVSVDWRNATFEKVEALEDNIRDAAAAHPNHPILVVSKDYRVFDEDMDLEDFDMDF